MPTEPPPLIAHVIHHLVIGGLENGLVNLINHIPEHRFRHAIICMENYSDFRFRIQRDDVDVIAIGKKPGQDPGAQYRLYKQLRALRPHILHTRNLTALDALLPGAIAGISRRVHGEHGRDANDVDGSNQKLQVLRKLHRPLIKHYIAVSQDLEGYLSDKIGVEEERITQIYNGVDTERFRPPGNGVRDLLPTDPAFANDGHVVVGAIGRLSPVKHQMLLARAVAQLVEQDPSLRDVVRLAIVGDGNTRADIEAYLQASGIAPISWMAGARDDVDVMYRGFDLFVLPSLGEGISNTILEAMASGLPVLATAVGGNVELVQPGVTGRLVPSDDVQAMADALGDYVRDVELRRAQSEAARRTALERYSMEAMVAGYVGVYDRL
ncbi:MAG: TIGR03088 family PEP-CTERM/XrtA system glycosyltransferase [Pseudomonadota bacterium]